MAESQDTGVRRLGVTQELLSLVTGLAHYLKLLIRICLQGALKLEREIGSEQGLHQFLDQINSLESKLEADEATELLTDASSYVRLEADTCPICLRPVEDRCFRQRNRVFHTSCMQCESCHRELSHDHESARWEAPDGRLFCSACVDDRSDPFLGNFIPITRLQQYVHLLRVAHARLLATLRTSGALPHTSGKPFSFVL